jgi:putative sigma-54 modulation protein
MEIKIEGRHFQVTDAIQDHVTEKLGKLERYFDGIHRLHVILDVEKSKRQRVELVCTVARRQTLVATGESDDLYAAVDQAGKKMIAEMKKYKAKLRPLVRGKRALEEATEVVESTEEE